jgi:hypothetical protein
LITFSRARTALVVALTAAAALPATASAMSVTVTGDDGNPIPLNGEVTIRNMEAKVAIVRSSGEDVRFSATFVGPDGANVAPPVSCVRSTIPRIMDYRGNGAYTIQVRTYNEPDSSCTMPPLEDQPLTYRYTVNAGVAVTPPPGRVLIREPNRSLIRPVAVPVSSNPGATQYEVRYAAGGVVGPDGAISGPSTQALRTRATNVPLRLTKPGRWTVVARVKNGDFFSPWSAPAFVDAVAPFDLRSARALDSRGPSYRISATVRERSAAGSRVRLAYARGTKGGKYRSLGRVTIDDKGVFTKRFTLRRSGTYRLRFVHPGSATVARGVVVRQLRVDGRLSFG